MGDQNIGACLYGLLNRPLIWHPGDADSAFRVSVDDAVDGVSLKVGIEVVEMGVEVVGG